MTETYDKVNHWFGWNGGTRPVHPDTVVEVVFARGELITGEAGYLDWGADNNKANIVAFRITRRKPREWWLAIRQDGVVYVTEDEQDAKSYRCPEVVQVREVLPEADHD